MSTLYFDILEAIPAEPVFALFFFIGHPPTPLTCEGTRVYITHITRMLHV